MGDREKFGSPRRGWLSGWGFSRHERRALLLLAALILVGSALRLHRDARLNRRFKVWSSAAAAAGDTPAGAPRHGTVIMEPVDLNSATAAQLELLPGIGSVKARRIVAYREQHGKFSRVDDLQLVYGIGPKTVKRLKGLAVVDSRSAAP